MEVSVDLHEETGKGKEQILANLSPVEEATSKDEDERNWKFFEGTEIQKHSVQYKGLFKSMEEIFWVTERVSKPASELDLLLSKLFISSPKQNGSEYCYLHGKRGLINILKDKEFSKAREVLCAKRKNLVRQGKRSVTRELTETEEDVLFEIGEFGV